MDTFLFVIGFICTVYTVLDLAAYAILRYRVGPAEFNRRAKAFLAPPRTRGGAVPKNSDADDDWEDY